MALNDVHAAAVITMLFGALHVGLNELGAPAGASPRCPYDGLEGVVVPALTLGVFAAAAAAPRALALTPERTAYVVAMRDVACLFPGIWFQVTVKPAYYFAAVPVDGCDLRSSGLAMLLWVLGEVLTFGAAVRLLGWLGWRWRTLLVAAVGGPALYFATDVGAAALRRAYAAG